MAFFMLLPALDEGDPGAVPLTDDGPTSTPNGHSMSTNPWLLSILAIGALACAKSASTPAPNPTGAAW
jgi:hypothetical protein